VPLRHPEEGISKFLRNVGPQPYTASQPTRHRLESSPLWDPRLHICYMASRIEIALLNNLRTNEPGITIVCLFQLFSSWMSYVSSSIYRSLFSCVTLWLVIKWPLSCHYQFFTDAFIPLSLVYIQLEIGAGIVQLYSAELRAG
jgi:hypothetical protein